MDLIDRLTQYCTIEEVDSKTIKLIVPSFKNGNKSQGVTENILPKGSDVKKYISEHIV